jgi:hypothetical protein
MSASGAGFREGLNTPSPFYFHNNWCPGKNNCSPFHSRDDLLSVCLKCIPFLVNFTVTLATFLCLAWILWQRYELRWLCGNKFWLVFPVTFSFALLSEFIPSNTMLHRRDETPWPCWKYEVIQSFAIMYEVSCMFLSLAKCPGRGTPCLLRVVIMHVWVLNLVKFLFYLYWGSYMDFFSIIRVVCNWFLRAFLD